MWRTADVGVKDQDFDSMRGKHPATIHLSKASTATSQEKALRIVVGESLL